MALKRRTKFVVGAFLLFFFGWLVARVILPPFLTGKVNEFVAREWLTPLDTARRNDWNSLLIPRKGRFLAERPAYAHMETHLHTGVDLQNRYRGEPGEPVYAVAKGKVYDVKIQAQGTRVTLLHLLPNGEIVYSSYIHVADVEVRKGMKVSPQTVLARRFHREELQKYGKIYNHLHFQIHKAKFDAEDTVRLKTREEVLARFYDPKVIFYNHHQSEKSDWREWVQSSKISFWKLLWIVF